MLLQVIHQTRYVYRPAVENAQHLAYLEPRSHASQRLLRHSIAIAPEPSQRREASDVYGNHRSFFSLQMPHDSLCVVGQSLLRTTAGPQPHSELPWELLRERLRYRAGGTFDPAGEFVFASPFVPHHAEFAAYAKRSFGPGRSLLEATHELMQRMHADFVYETYSTHINTPALQALAQRKGVCQDFAHIMLGCLRSLGLPARYVSGYLLTQALPGKVKLVGSDASHAWVSVYLPDLPEGRRWCDFDPTNNRWGWHAPGEDYVTLAIGRDFGDVSPLRGVIYGGASHTLEVGVSVEEVGADLLAGLDGEVGLISADNAAGRMTVYQSQSQGSDA